jgi:hypothetical protein
MVRLAWRFALRKRKAKLLWNVTKKKFIRHA